MKSYLLLWQRSPQFSGFHPESLSVFSFISPLTWATMHLSCHLQCGNFKLCRNIAPGLMIISVYCLIFQRKRFPFDRRKPAGYLAAVTLQFIMSTYGFALVANMSCFGIGCYFFALSLIDDLKSILESISKSLKHKMDRPSIPAKLTEFIQIHSMAKQLS